MARVFHIRQAHVQNINGQCVSLKFSPALTTSTFVLTCNFSNVCYAAFMEPRNLAQVLLEVGTFPPDALGSIKVRTKHLGHKKKLIKMGAKSARNEIIRVDSKRMSVEQYFKQSKSISRESGQGGLLTIIRIQENPRVSSFTTRVSRLYGQGWWKRTYLGAS